MRNDFTSEWSVQASLDTLEQIACQCALEGGPVAQQLVKLAGPGTRQELIDFDFRASYMGCTYDSSAIRDILMARQIQALYSKSEFLDLGIDKAGVAFSRFKEAEDMCLETNKRFLTMHEAPEKSEAEFHPILHRAAQICASVLGRLPKLEELNMAFGPGANTNVKGCEANPRAKLSARLQCSHELSPFLDELLNEVPSWAASHFCKYLEIGTDDMVHGVAEVDVANGKLIFVPKNAKTDRSICIEPILNGFLQKGLGSYIRDRLKASVGVDLKDQTENQRLAAFGSITGELATLDLSMASDTLSYELVRSLVPHEWFYALKSARTRRIDLPDGTQIDQNKFSSMGNGYTFELESMIFYALTKAVAQHLDLPTRKISVYGDDIICPVACVPLLQRTLEYCGFRVNTAKSFTEGPFRESCGADYLFGFNIRPYYQKKLISSQSLFSMHNFFMRAGETSLAKYVESLIPSNIKLFGPDGYGDGHLIGSYNIRSGRKVQRCGWDGGTFESYTTSPKRLKKPLKGDALIPVYSVYIRGSQDGPYDPYVVRGHRGYSKVLIYTHRRSIFGG